MAERRLLSPADLDFGAAAAADAEFDLRKAREGLERRLIRRSLSRHRGRLTRAAAELGVSRPTLYELIEKLGIERPATEPDG
jgi:two-component system NtrC family response regulator